jgi:hypothetical protein
MTTADWLTIVAIVAAPFAALHAQQRLERWREKRSRRERVFKALMATRGATLSLDHVGALNMIVLEFTEKEHEGVRRAWRAYHDLLNSFPKEGDDLEQRRTNWSERSSDLIADLLGKMGRSLGYDFDDVALKKGWYTPVGHLEERIEWQMVRKGLLALLSGEHPLRTTGVPVSDEAEKFGLAARAWFQALIEGRASIGVRIDERSTADKTTHES